jgi:Ni,Fe-hydrogenase III large subunit/Ni,Fe-hydrogenase III component G
MGRWPHGVEVRRQDERGLVDLHCAPNHVPEICNWLGDTCDYSFAGLMVEQGPEAWSLRYLFYGAEDRSGWAHVATHAPLAQTSFPSISHHVHAADWHEREAEDMYGLVFTGHPRLGDFVLHDDAWQEGVAPMRKEFDRGTAFAQRLPDAKWRPTRLVHAPGAFAMPIGPVYASVTESAHFLLETVGEDVIRAFPRLFYGYRAVEKIAEGRTVDDALLLAERFSATTAFAHGLAYVQAAETITGIHVPARARVLRVLLAELERLRHHAGAIQEICESTALAVAASQASILEEDLLRLSGELTGHRYLFGLLAAGGLTRDFGDDAWRAALDRARAIVNELNMLALLLRNTSSFLDRLEEVGIVSHQEARTFGLVGPVARASGVARDLRRAQPYSDYERYAFDVACEQEGDGYARLRVLFTEARQSLQIMEQAAVGLSDGPVRVEAKALSGGAALGWVEAPRGAAFHWLHVGEDGKVLRYHIVSPSFINWHSFRLAAERFAFQDFPIILASFGLSAVENDR